MTPRRAAALCLALTTSCRPRAHRDGAVDVPSPRDVAVVRAPAPAAPIARWCWQPRQRVDVRALDADGGLWSIVGHTLLDETHEVASPMEVERPCPTPGRWSLEFRDDGTAFALADSRLHTRAAAHAPFRVAPMCSDLGGAPYARALDGGWHFIANTWRMGATVMSTRDVTGSAGWFATTAVERSTTSVVVSPDRSMLTLANEGHAILVDNARTVAGELLPAHGELFAGITRRDAGVVAFRDASPTRRVLLVAETVTGDYARVESERPAGTPTRAVFAVDLARFVAVTDDAVELSVDRGEHFVEVFRTAAGDGGGARLERPSVGWLPGHTLAVATRDGLVAEACSP